MNTIFGIFRLDQLKKVNLFWWGVLMMCGFLLLFAIEPLTGAMHWGMLALPFALLATCYSFVLWRASNAPLSDMEKRAVLLFSALFIVALFILWPVGSADVFGAIARTQVATTMGANPFIFAPDHLTNQFTVLSCACWIDIPYQYGPLWLAASILPVALGTGSFFLTFFLYKFFVAVFLGGTAFLVFRIVRRIAPARAWGAATAVLWNPLLLFESVNGAHNDIAMALFLVAAFGLFTINTRNVWILPLITLGGLIKYLPFISLPLVGVGLWRIGGASRIARLRWIGIGLGLSFMLAALLYAPFWNGARTFDGVLRASSLTQIGEHSPGAYALLMLAGGSLNVTLPSLVIMTVNAFVVMVTLILMMRTLGNKLMRASLVLFTAFLLIGIHPLNPWYLVPLVPLLSLAIGTRAHMLLLLGVTIFGLFIYPLTVPILSLLLTATLFGLMGIITWGFTPHRTLPS